MPLLASMSEPVIFNQFFFPGKVPSLNDLNAFRAIQSPVTTSIIRRRKAETKRSFGRFNLYNQVKQEWSKKVIGCVKKQGYKSVHHAYFSYLIVERSRKRDPSNICAAGIKFIEDGLIKAGVIPNDGWENVLGINVHWIHEKHSEAGIYMLMTDVRVEESYLVETYKNGNLIKFISSDKEDDLSDDCEDDD